MIRIVLDMRNEETRFLIVGLLPTRDVAKFYCKTRHRTDCSCRDHDNLHKRTWCHKDLRLKTCEPARTGENLGNGISTFGCRCLMRRRCSGCMSVCEFRVGELVLACLHFCSVCVGDCFHCQRNEVGRQRFDVYRAVWGLRRVAVDDKVSETLVYCGRDRVGVP